MYKVLTKKYTFFFFFKTKKYADVIIPRGAENVIAIDLIVKHIKQKLESLQQEKKN